jgi:hypothetical protein
METENEIQQPENETTTPTIEPSSVETEMQLEESETVPLSELRKLRRENQNLREKGKENAAAAKRLVEIEAANASDLDKAILKARDEERSIVSKEYGLKAAKNVLKLGLTQRMKEEDADALLDDLNIAKFVTETGELDEEAITNTLKRLTPQGKSAIDLGQGGRGEGPSMQQQINDATKRGDIKEAIRLTNLSLAVMPQPR